MTIVTISTLENETIETDELICIKCEAPEENNANSIKALFKLPPNCKGCSGLCHHTSLPVPQYSDFESVMKMGMFDRDTRGKPGYNYPWNQVPPYLRRPYILHHYRAHLGVKECFKSLFAIHNETFDCWSHGLGAIYFWFMCINIALSPPSSFYWPIVLFCASHGIVFSVSFFAHTFNPINEKCCICCFQYDWSAISFAILGGGVSAISYISHCSPFKQQVYCLLLALPCLVMFAMANTRWFVTKTPFVKTLLALSPISLSVAWIAYDAMTSMVIDQYFLRDMQLPGLVAAIGVIIYATHFPERVSPGSFDLIFNSHSFHHIWSLGFAFLVLQNLLSWSNIAENKMCQ